MGALVALADRKGSLDPNSSSTVKVCFLACLLSPYANTDAPGYCQESDLIIVIIICSQFSTPCMLQFGQASAMVGFLRHPDNYRSLAAALPCTLWRLDHCPSTKRVSLQKR